MIAEPVDASARVRAKGLAMNGRLKREARRRQTAVYSLCGAILVAVSIAGMWWMMRVGPSAATALQRRISDQAVVWRCPNGHRFEARGRARRLECAECGRRSDMEVTYVCPRDGDVPALIRVERGAGGREALSEVSLRPGVWEAVGSSVRCPKCDRHLTPQVENLMGLKPEGP